MKINLNNKGYELKGIEKIKVPKQIDSLFYKTTNKVHINKDFSFHFMNIKNWFYETTIDVSGKIIKKIIPWYVWLFIILIILLVVIKIWY